MKLSTREDIDAPVDAVFEAVTDFDAFERALLRRGIDITRDERLPRDAAGAHWRARLTWRERPHDIEATLEAIKPGEGYVIEMRGSGILALGVVDLVALSRTRTRLFVSVDLRPESFSARLLIQSLKLAKASLVRRFKARVEDFARHVGERV